MARVPVASPGDLARSAVSSRRMLAYWVTTLLTAAELGVGGVWDLLRTPTVRETMEHLGYPAYLPLILGTWKVLGAVALLVPRLPRLKEWAYAGVVFLSTGAAASHLRVGGGAGVVLFLVASAGLAAASWALRPPSRRDLAPRYRPSAAAEFSRNREPSRM